MNIRRISYGLIAAATMLTGGTSCYDSHRDKAKEDAIKYLSGTEFRQAEHYAWQQPNNEVLNCDRVVYWDSILANDKVQKAYALGRQMVKDSVEGKNYERPDYTPKFDTIMTQEDIVKDIRKEVAEYHTTEEYKEYRVNEPGIFGLFHLSNETHYWNLITMAGRQKEAFEQGAADMRKELSLSSKGAEIIPTSDTK